MYKQWQKFLRIMQLTKRRKKSKIENSTSPNNWTIKNESPFYASIPHSIQCLNISKMSTNYERKKDIKIPFKAILVADDDETVNIHLI